MNYIIWEWFFNSQTLNLEDEFLLLIMLLSFWTLHQAIEVPSKNLNAKIIWKRI